jgi:hypothetical protein
MTPARTTVAARLRASAPSRPDEARILAEADRVETGEPDGSWAVFHELKRMEADVSSKEGSI